MTPDLSRIETALWSALEAIAGVQEAIKETTFPFEGTGDPKMKPWLASEMARLLSDAKHPLREIIGICSLIEQKHSATLREFVE